MDRRAPSPDENDDNDVLNQGFYEPNDDDSGDDNEDFFFEEDFGAPQTPPMTPPGNAGQHPEGVAFEIHKAFASMNVNKILNFLREKIRETTGSEYVSPGLTEEEIKDRVESSLLEFYGSCLGGNPMQRVHGVPIDRAQLNTLKQQLDVIIDRLNRADIPDFDDYDPDRPESLDWFLVPLTYVRLQRDLFQRFYLETFVHDTANAYESNSNPEHNYSCVRGTYERMLTSLNQAARLSSEYPDSRPFDPEEKAEYVQLYSMMAPTKEILEGRTSLFFTKNKNKGDIEAAPESERAAVLQRKKEELRQFLVDGFGQYDANGNIIPGTGEAFLEEDLRTYPANESDNAIVNQIDRHMRGDFVQDYMFDDFNLGGGGRTRGIRRRRRIKRKTMKKPKRKTTRRRKLNKKRRGKSKRR